MKKNYMDYTNHSWTVLYKGGVGGWVFKKKRKEKGGLDFFPKWDVGKMGVCFKKGGITYFQT